MTRSNNLTKDARQSPDRQDARTIERSIGIEARPDTVWAILSQPDGFSRWMDGAAAFEARAGSPFRVDFPNFGVVKAGEVAAFDAEAMHLAVTWGSEEGPQAQTVPAGSTLVEFRVRETADGCQVDLRHGGFSSDTAAAEHDAGWRFHLGRLELMANRADLSAGLERTLIKRWFEAWNEADPDTRLAVLRECCFDDVEFRDEWAVARDVESLSLHIDNCHRFMPGWQIEAAGEPRVCRGEALVGWRSTGPSGTVEGFNHVRAACDGRMRRVAGFGS